MKAKKNQKKLAIELRKKGLSFSEILKYINVSQASLSQWLKNIVLTPKQQERLEKIKAESPKKAGLVRHAQRLLEIKSQYNQAKIEVGLLSKREIFLIAAALYWAEGTKQRSKTKSRGVEISNSDPGVLLVFYQWLCFLGVKNASIHFTLQVHELYKEDEENIKKYWQQFFPNNNFQWMKTTFKKHLKTKPIMRYNQATPEIREGLKSNIYYGILRLGVRRSGRLNRFLAGAARAIAQQMPGGVMATRLPLKQDSLGSSPSPAAIP